MPIIKHLTSQKLYKNNLNIKQRNTELIKQSIK